MTKLSTRYGDMFSCGWLPPVAVMQAGFIAEFCAVLYWLDPEKVAHTFPDALGADGPAVEPTGV